MGNKEVRRSLVAKGLGVFLLGVSSAALALPTVTMVTSTTKAVTGRNFVALTATATPTSGTTISKVEFYRRSGTTDTLLYTDTLATNGDKKYHYVIWNLPTGSYTYFARAYDATGSTSTTTTTVAVLSTPDRDPVGDSVDTTALIAYAKDRGKYKSMPIANFPAYAKDTAAAGEVISLEGSSTTAFPGAIFARSGTSSDPIVYLPASGMTFTSSGGSEWKIRGTDIVLAGFRFSNFNARGTLIIFESNAQRVRLTGSTFTNIGKINSAGAPVPNSPIVDMYVSIAGASAGFNRLDHNAMDGNKSIGMRIAPPYPLPPETRVTYANGLTTAALYDEYTPAFSGNRFDHNVYRNITLGTHNNDVNSGIPLQIGNYSDHMVYKTDSMIDNNSFVNVATQTVNSKSTGESYLYNTFDSVGGVGLSLRTGDYKRVEGNLLKNVVTAIKVVGQNHVVVNNIIDNSLVAGSIKTNEALLMHKWGSLCSTCTCAVAAPAPTPSTYANSSAKLSSSCEAYYPKTANNTIAFNTVRNVQGSAVDLDRKWGSGTTLATQQPTGTILRNNIFSNDGAGANPSAVLVRDGDTSDGVTPNATIDRNLYYGANFGLVGTNSVQYVLPGLGAGYMPNASSPVLNVGVDISGVTKDYYFGARKVGAASDLGAVEKP